jgi:hypothetical protein
MAAMLTLVGVSDDIDRGEDELAVEAERGALVVLSEDEFRQVIRRLGPDEPQAA